MKTNQFFQDKKKDITTFMLATMMVLGAGYYCAHDDFKASSLCHHTGMTGMAYHITEAGEPQPANMSSFIKLDEVKDNQQKNDAGKKADIGETDIIRII